jgi:hypothetical protein
MDDGPSYGVDAYVAELNQHHDYDLYLKWKGVDSTMRPVPIPSPYSPSFHNYEKRSTSSTYTKRRVLMAADIRDKRHEIGHFEGQLRRKGIDDVIRFDAASATRGEPTESDPDWMKFGYAFRRFPRPSEYSFMWSSYDFDDDPDQRLRAHYLRAKIELQNAEAELRGAEVRAHATIRK